MPKANGISIYYTTDGSSPVNVIATTYDGKFRVPPTCRMFAPWLRAMRTN
ncbi:MAG TPA: chitobiase/beta-hexosaminidase C-terminal domain-containing protein [Acidobacteriaceae bacterium]